MRSPGQANGKTFIIEGIFRAVGKGVIKEDGEQAGELIGPKVQAKDSSAASLSPTVTDNGSSYTVTLSGTTSVTLVKGMASSGGSITVSGTTTPLRTDVQQISVTDTGPAWQ